MNAKEQIIKLLKEQLDQLEMQMPGKYRQVHKLRQLITATEAAIFDVPSEGEMTKECMKFTDTAKNVQNAIIYTVGFGDGCNFILNYKKPTE
jgi:hypothetical protein